MSVGAESTEPPLRCAYEREQVDRLAMETAAKLEELRIAVEALAICVESLDGSDKLSIDSNRRAIRDAFSVMASQMKVIRHNMRLIKEAK